MNYRLLQDDILVVFLKEHDAKAFNEIYNRYWQKIFSVAYHQTGNKHEAEELVHDLFESLWNKREISQIKHLSSYLVVSIKYLSTNFIKSQINHRKFQEYLIFNELKESHSTEELIYFTDLSDAIEQAIKKLPEKSNEVFKMSRFENKSVKDIAENLNISEKAVEYHITKSIKMLRENLKEYHFDN